MPPKRSARGKKKVESVVNAADDQSVTGTELLTTEQKSGHPESKDSLLSNGKATPALENGNVEEEPVATKKRGRPRNATEPEAVSKNAKRGKKASTENHDSDEKTNENPDAKEDGFEKMDPTVPKNAKKGGKASPENLNSDEKKKQEPEIQETSVENTEPEAVPKNAKKGKKAGPKSLDSDERTNQEPETKETAEEKTEPDTVPKNAKRGKKETQKNHVSEEKTKQNSETQETVLEETEPEEVPKNAKRGRKANPETKEAVPDKADVTNEQEPAVVSKKTRGRGRKQATTAVQAVEKKPADPASVIGDRVLQVSLLRQKSLDNMALEELKNAEEKVKSAAGASKKRGKRAQEDEEDSSKPAKARKGAASSGPKKKIPDVGALDFTNESTTKSGEDWNLKIASWNINGVRAWLEKDGVSYLHKESPDIVCLQETKCSDDKLPKEANVEGYHCYWLAGDKDGYSGVGMLAKKKPLSVEYGIGLEEHDAEGRVITADFDKFYLVASYVPNSGRGLVRLEYRKKWDLDFRAYVKKLDQTKPVILCGDLNVAHEEIDLANPKGNKKNAGFTQEERDGFSALLAEGFVDTYRQLYPDKKGAYTFWTYMMNARAKNVGWRLDYFVMSERFADRLCDCCIRSEVMGSDHCPLVLFLSI